MFLVPAHIAVRDHKELTPCFRIGAARILDNDIASLQRRIDEAGENATTSTKHALYHARKERAALEIVKCVTPNIYARCRILMIISVYMSVI